jgi:hypothetical protein
VRAEAARAVVVVARAVVVVARAVVVVARAVVVVVAAREAQAAPAVAREAVVEVAGAEVAGVEALAASGSAAASVAQAAETDGPWERAAERMTRTDPFESAVAASACSPILRTGSSGTSRSSCPLAVPGVSIRFTRA